MCVEPRLLSFRCRPLVVAWLAAVVASSNPVAVARAADLGGNCCEDLEERIAEIEGTPTGKGNRKVLLTVSGWSPLPVLSFSKGSWSLDLPALGGVSVDSSG